LKNIDVKYQISVQRQLSCSMRKDRQTDGRKDRQAGRQKCMTKIKVAFPILRTRL